MPQRGKELGRPFAAHNVRYVRFAWPSPALEDGVLEARGPKAPKLLHAQAPWAHRTAQRSACRWRWSAGRKIRERIRSLSMVLKTVKLCWGKGQQKKKRKRNKNKNKTPRARALHSCAGRTHPAASRRRTRSAPLAPRRSRRWRCTASSGGASFARPPSTRRLRPRRGWPGGARSSDQPSQLRVIANTQKEEEEEEGGGKTSWNLCWVQAAATRLPWDGGSASCSPWCSPWYSPWCRVRSPGTTGGPRWWPRRTPR